MRVLRRGTSGNQRSTDRLEAFSDAVIAIAITLLVLEIRVPAEADVEAAGGLVPALLNLWPAYLGFLISFLTIGVMWVNHHDIFRHIARTDHTLVMVNLLFLFCIGFMPFPTGLLAENLGHDGERVAVVVYAGWFLVTVLSYFLLWWYPSHDGRLLAPDADPGAVRSVSRNFRVGPPAYLLAFILAFFAPRFSLGLMLLLALLYTLPNAGAD